MPSEDVKKFAQNQAKVRGEIEELLRQAQLALIKAAAASSSPDEALLVENQTDYLESIALSLYALAVMKLNGWG